MKRLIGLALAMTVGLTLIVSTASADKSDKKKDKESEKKDEAKITCPISGKPVDPDATVEYKGGEVSFCCMNCPKAFAANMEKFATKANLQLVLTKQAKLVKCPIAGRKLNPATKIEVAGAAVCFCCNNCKGKVANADEKEQLELVFSDKAFEKGFEVSKKESEEKKKEK